MNWKVWIPVIGLITLGILLMMLYLFSGTTVVATTVGEEHIIGHISEVKIGVSTGEEKTATNITKDGHWVSIKNSTLEIEKNNTIEKYLKDIESDIEKLP